MHYWLVICDAFAADWTKLAQIASGYSRVHANTTAALGVQLWLNGDHSTAAVSPALGTSQNTYADHRALPFALQTCFKRTFRATSEIQQEKSAVGLVCGAYVGAYRLLMKENVGEALSLISTALEVRLL